MANNFNLNNTTPAAPAGSTAIAFATDGSGNISASVVNNVATQASVDLTLQGANIAATTAYTVGALPARFRVSAYIIVTRVATTSSTLPSVTISWTDVDNATVQSFTLTPTNTGNVLTTFQQAIMVVSAAAATNIQYSTSGYASVGATSMQYALHIKVEAL